MRMEGGTAHSNKHHNRRFIQPLLPDFLNSFSIPTSFVKHLEYDDDDETVTVVLMCDYQPHRHWVVKLESRGCFGVGWKDFCLHLDLRIGDFLLFTYLSHLLFHVTVFDSASSCHRTFPSPTPNNIIIGEQSNTAPNKTLPQDVTTHSILSCRLNLSLYSIQKTIIYLPAHFLRQSQLEGRKCQVKIVDEEDRTWKVGLGCRRSRPISYICRGWRDVQNANGFKMGDVLCFQLLQAGEQPMLKCYRPNDTGEESNGTCKTIPKKALAGDVTTSSFHQNPSQYLSCHVRLSSYSVSKTIIFLPVHFVRESRLKCRSCKAKVVDEEERTWEVSLGFGRSNSKSYICRGWRDVQNANGFRMGDVLCFQLLQAGECPILKCYRDSRRKKTRPDKVKGRRRLVGAA